MRTTPWLGAAVIVALLTACDLTVPDYNNADLNDLQNNPTRSGVATAATGLLVAMRDEFDDRNGYVSLIGILGRESYNFDGADPRFITEMLEGPLDPASPAFGANLWEERYRNIRQGDIILNALDGLVPGEMSDEELEAVRGFTKTMIAHELLLVVNTRDSLGAVITVNPDPLADPELGVSRNAVLLEVASLLEEAKTHLDAGGSSFPFALSSGFAGFDTPATFEDFNRALKARVSVYLGTLDPANATAHFTDAIEALDSSFYSLTNTFAEHPQVRDVGVYHAFGTGSGDNINELFDPGQTPDIVAHPSIFADAELLPGAIPPATDSTVDLRYQRKLRRVTSQTQRDLNTDLAFDIYASLSAPMPIIRNEELILLRAEAELGLGNLPAAVTLIDFIRDESGGLLPYAGPVDAASVETELLTQKRYSLLFEGGHRWIDLRRYGRMGDLPLDIMPPDPRAHRINRAFPIPEAECLARGEATPCDVVP